MNDNFAGTDGFFEPLFRELEDYVRLPSKLWQKDFELANVYQASVFPNDDIVEFMSAVPNKMNLSYKNYTGSIHLGKRKKLY